MRHALQLLQLLCRPPAFVPRLSHPLHRTGVCASQSWRESCTNMRGETLTLPETQTPQRGAFLWPAPGLDAAAQRDIGGA